MKNLLRERLRRRTQSATCRRLRVLRPAALGVLRLDFAHGHHQVDGHVLAPERDVRPELVLLLLRNASIALHREVPLAQDLPERSAESPRATVTIPVGGVLAYDPIVGQLVGDAHKLDLIQAKLCTTPASESTKDRLVSGLQLSIRRVPPAVVVCAGKRRSD